MIGVMAPVIYIYALPYSQISPSIHESHQVGYRGMAVSVSSILISKSFLSNCSIFGLHVKTHVKIDCDSQNEQYLVGDLPHTLHLIILAFNSRGIFMGWTWPKRFSRFTLYIQYFKLPEWKLYTFSTHLLPSMVSYNGHYESHPWSKNVIGAPCMVDDWWARLLG